MLRTAALAILLSGLLGACADQQSSAQRTAIQDRELNLPIDACIRHSSGDQEVAPDLLAAGYQRSGDAKYRREFSDLDNALSAQGAVDVTLGQECTLFIPIHVAVLDELNARIKARLAAQGFTPTTATGAAQSNGRKVAYSKGNTRLSYSGFARSYALLGFASTIRFSGQ